MKPYILSSLFGAALFFGTLSNAAAQTGQPATGTDGWGTEQTLTPASDSTRKSASISQSTYGTTDSLSVPDAEAKPAVKTHISSYRPVSAAGISAAKANEKGKPKVIKHKKLPKQKEHVHKKPFYPSIRILAANDKRAYRNVYKPYQPDTK